MKREEKKETRPFIFFIDKVTSMQLYLTYEGENTSIVIFPTAATV